MLERASPEENGRVAKRAMGRVVRDQYTRQLDSRGVNRPIDLGICKNEIYSGLFDRTAKQLKVDKGIKPAASLRDAMSMKEIAFVAASEALSIERVEEEKANGFPECRRATAKGCAGDARGD